MTVANRHGHRVRLHSVSSEGPPGGPRNRDGTRAPPPPGGPQAPGPWASSRSEGRWLAHLPSPRWRGGLSRRPTAERQCRRDPGRVAGSRISSRFDHRRLHGWSTPWVVAFTVSGSRATHPQARAPGTRSGLSPAACPASSVTTRRLRRHSVSPTPALAAWLRDRVYGRVRPVRSGRPPGSFDPTPRSRGTGGRCHCHPPWLRSGGMARCPSGVRRRPRVGCQRLLTLP